VRERDGKVLFHGAPIGVPLRLGEKGLLAAA
jgi:hypothetical protein